MNKVCDGLIQSKDYIPEFEAKYEHCNAEKLKCGCCSSTCMYSAIDEDWTVVFCMAHRKDLKEL